ncbi:dentin sialophosphoprotein-like [Quillaja saponaria]|uniref:Dentin sialophosphoprotein-like n=1 Tax=Quillaja saponaria TaxID=32244 RepID=A0AAD7LX15_QUISA|nr:dentin sialophosphoprotein-like [Quillaja saponaria]
MSSRNQRSKGFKVKHTLQICVSIAICIWLLYQLKQYHDNKTYEKASAKISEKVDVGHEIKFGRKGLHPPMTTTGLGIERHGGVKTLEGGDNEIGGHDQDREEEEESEEVEDLIDEEDKEREEESEEEEMEKAIEDASSGEDEKITKEATEKHYKNNDASGVWINSIGTKFEIGGLSKMK